MPSYRSGVLGDDRAKHRPVALRGEPRGRAGPKVGGSAPVLTASATLESRERERRPEHARRCARTALNGPDGSGDAKQSPFVALPHGVRVEPVAAGGGKVTAFGNRQQLGLTALE